MMTGAMLGLNIAIWAVAVGLLVYAYRMRARGVLLGLGPETEQADLVPSLGRAASPGPRQPVYASSNALISSLSRSIPSAQRRLISTIGLLRCAVAKGAAAGRAELGN